MATNFFPSRKRHCTGCLQRKITVNGEEVVEYYHRGVVCHVVGFDLALPLDVEMQRIGEGEIAAAKRLLERVFTTLPRFFDVILGDALYCEADFFNFCIQHGKEVVAVLKGDDRLLKRDAALRFSSLPSQRWVENRREIEAWDLDGFTSMTGVDGPIRVLHSHETRTVKKLVDGKRVDKTEQSHWWWATTIKQAQLSTRKPCKAGHSRWDIENDSFNELSRSWGLDHCFKHSPNAILTFILTNFIAQLLLQCFYKRNLKPDRRAGLPLIGLAREIFADWVTAGYRALWLMTHAQPDTS